MQVDNFVFVDSKMVMA